MTMKQFSTPRMKVIGTQRISTYYIEQSFCESLSCWELQPKTFALKHLTTLTQTLLVQWKPLQSDRGNYIKKIDSQN